MDMEREHKKKLKIELYNDSMQNWKSKPIQKAQLIIADVPYNVGTNFYGSNPVWYNGGDNKNGESKLAGKAAFASDFNFNLYEYFHFCSQLFRKAIGVLNGGAHWIEDIKEYTDCGFSSLKWQPDTCYCSRCGHGFSVIDNCTEEFDFCPHCGAEMDG